MSKKKKTKRRERRKRKTGYERFVWVHLRTLGCVKGTADFPCINLLVHSYIPIFPFSFAFVDFSNTDNATSALINPKNHHLNGRNLVVEYASADAVKRGPNKPRVVAGEGGPGDFKRKFGPRVNGSQNKPFRRNERDLGTGDEKSSNRFKDKPDYRHNAEESQTADHKESSTPRFGGRPYRKDQDGAPRHKGPRNRPKPGAALAQAKRQSAAIVPTSGKKIVF